MTGASELLRGVWLAGRSILRLKSIFVAAAIWLTVFTGLHLWLNFDWSAMLNEYRPVEERKLNVAFIPVT